MKITTKITLNITNLVLGITLFGVLAFNFIAQAHLEGTGTVNDEMYSKSFHAVSIGGVAGSIVLHPGTEPDAIDDAQKIWVDNFGVLNILDQNNDPQTKVSNPVSGVAETKIFVYDENSTYAIGEVVTVFGIPFVNNTAVTVPEVFVPAKWTCLIPSMHSGILDGVENVEVDATDKTKINVTGVITYVTVQNFPTYIVSPLQFPVTAGIANSLVATDRATRLFLDSTGALIQKKGLSDSDIDNLAFIGETENREVSPGVFESFNIFIRPIVAYEGSSDSVKISHTLGGQVINSFTFAAGATGLTLDIINSGRILGNGLGYVSDKNNPNIGTISLQAPIANLRRVWEEKVNPSDLGAVLTIDFASTNVIDPNNYNPGELSLDPVPAGDYTVQRLYVSPIGQDHIIYYGRTLYSTLDDARRSFNTADVYAENSDTRGISAFAGWLIVRQGITDWSDSSTFFFVNACQTGQTIGRGRPSAALEITPAQEQSALAGKSTGVFSGGGLSGTIGLTTFEIALGTGQVIDNTVPGTTTEDSYEWDDFVAVPLTELATAKHTFVFLQKVAGVVTVVQIGDNSVITEIDRKNKLYLGVIRHGTGTFVGAISQPQTVVSPGNKLIDFYIATGKVRLSSGNEITSTGAGLLTIDKGLGKSYGIGVNAFNDGNNTDFVDNPALAAVAMLKYSSVGHIDGALISNVDTSRYDPNGATTDSELVALTGGATRVAHRVWIEAVSNLVIFQYGQASYATEDDAIAQWRQEDLSLPTGLNESSYLKEVIIVQNGAANLDGAVFVPVEGIGGSGGVITPTNVIDNLLSTDPNSALSANQGNVLDTGNLGDTDLTLSAFRFFDLANLGLQIHNQSLANVRLALISGQSVLAYNANNVSVEPDKIDLQLNAANSDLRLSNNPGLEAQVITSHGPANAPTWAAPANISNTNLILDADRILDLNTNMLTILSGANPAITIDPTPGVGFITLDFEGNELRVFNDGILFDFDPTDHLSIDGSPGISAQVLTSNGPDLPPTWSATSNLGNANQTLTGLRTVNLGSDTLLFSSNVSGLMLTLQPGALGQSTLSHTGGFFGVKPSGLELDFAVASDLLIDGDPGLIDQVFTSAGPDLPPIWKNPPGALDPNSYISINGTGLIFDGVTSVESTAGFGDNYNVIPLVDADLEITNDPSGMITGNTLDIKVAGVYEIFWGYFYRIGSITYNPIRVNGTIIASGGGGSESSGSAHAFVKTTITLAVGDKIEFGTTISTGTADGMRKPSIFLNQIR